MGQTNHYRFEATLRLSLISHEHISSSCFKDHHQDKKDLLDKNLHFAQKSGPILVNDPQIGTKLSAVFSRFLQFGCLRHTNIGRLTNTSLAFLTNTSPACLANLNLMHSYIVISGKRMETISWECDNCQKVSSNAFWYPKTLDQSIMLTITKITISTPSTSWRPQPSRQATLTIPSSASPSPPRLATTGEPCRREEKERGWGKGGKFLFINENLCLAFQIRLSTQCCRSWGA